MNESQVFAALTRMGTLKSALMDGGLGLAIGFGQVPTDVGGLESLDGVGVSCRKVRDAGNDQDEQLNRESWNDGHAREGREARVVARCQKASWGARVVQLEERRHKFGF